jgi:MFS family permease
MTSRRRWRDLIVVGWSHAGQHAYVAGLGVAIPFVVAGFHSDYAVVGALLSVSAIAGSALQSLALVVRRVSARALLTMQNVGSALGAAISAVAPGIGVFMGGRFLQAVAGWPQHPIGSSYLSNRYPERKGTILSWHVTAGNVGTLVAPLAVGAVIASGGWQWGFGLLSILLATTALGVALFLPASWKLLPERLARPGGMGTTLQASRERAPGASPFVRADLEPASLPQPSFKQQVVNLVRQRPVLALLVAGTIAAGGQGIGILGVYVPAYLHTSLHFSALKLSILLTVVYVGAVVGPVLMGTIADHVGHRIVLLANYALGAAALVGFYAVGKGVWGLAAIGLGMGIFSYSELSLRQTLFSDYLSGGLARAGFGIFFTVSQSIGAIWVAIIGLVITEVSFGAAFLVMAFTFLVAGVIVLSGTINATKVEEDANLE